MTSNTLPVQALLPLEPAADQPVLPLQTKQEILASLAELLIQVTRDEKAGEGEDELDR